MNTKRDRVCTASLQPDSASSLTWLQQGAVYATGMFSHSMRQMAVVVIPLWAVLLDASPMMIGIIIGARSVMPIFFAIHGGVLMDRLGARRVLLVSGALATLLPLLFPAAPWIATLIAFQLLAGLAENIGVLGAHTLVGQFAKGSSTHSGRLSFVIFIGQFAGPPLVGAAWDLMGPWGAFGFLCLWACCGLVAASLLPGGFEPGAKRPVPAERTPRFSLASLMPSTGDYASTMKLMLAGGVAVVLTVTGMRYVGVAVQGSFYVVYLEQLGIAGTAIGLLLTAAGALAAAGSVITGWLGRFVSPFALLFGSVALSVALICITPLLGSYLALVIVSSLRGSCMGISSAVSLSALSGLVAADIQGRAFGLRMTINRGLSAVLPVLMGAVVELVGLEASFYVVGTLALTVLAVAALAAARLSAREEAAGAGPLPAAAAGAAVDVAAVPATRSLV